MDSTELTKLEARARRRYERARLVRGVVGFAPVVALVACAALLGRRPASAVGIGGVLFVAGAALLWFGRSLHRAVLPGVLTGLVPLGLALAANWGHGCAGDHCSTLCVPACAAGGLAAGAVVSTLSHRRKHGWGFWLSASVVSLLTGAMGCACVGYSGVIGLLAGFAAGVAPQAARKLLAPSAGPPGG